MKHTPVVSSAIKSVGFDKTTNEIEVTFHSGGSAKHGATLAQYNALMSAHSIGAKYSELFKHGKQSKVDATIKMKK